MFAQIISHTPTWVWALLAFLVYRGVLASADREVTLRQISIIPLVMLALSWQGIAATFGVAPLTVGCWLASAGIAVALNWQLFRKDRIVPHPERGVLFQRGSWLPLALMMAIFVTKYAVAVLLAIQPPLAHQAAFTAAVCALYGLFNGMFIGRLLRIVSLYRNAQPAAGAYGGSLNN